MKAFTLFVLAALAAQCLGQEAKEIRRVNGISVDITPVVQWFRTDKKGTRPMPHWKQLQVVEVVTTQPWFKVHVVNETGGNAEIFLKNPSRELKAHYAAIVATEKKVKELEAEKGKGVETRKAREALDALKRKRMVEFAMSNGKYGNTEVWDTGKL